MDELKRARSIGAASVLALIALLAMYEIGRTINAVAVDGTTYSSGALYNLIGVWNAGTAMHGWALAACSGIPIKAWLWWFLGFDVPFIAGYALFAFGLNERWKLSSAGWIWLMIVADIVEDALEATGIGLFPHGAACTATAGYHVPGLFGALIATTTVKWLALAVLLVRTAWVVTHDAGLRATFALTFKAIVLQRFVVIVVAVLAVFLLLPGAPVLEQGIDVERAWILTPSVPPALWGIALMALLAAGLRYLASVRVAPFRADPENLGAVEGEDEPAAALEYRAAGPLSWPARAGYWGKAFGASLWQARAWWIAAIAITVVIWLVGMTPAVRVYWRSAMWIGIVLAAIPLLSAAFALLKSPAVINVYDQPLRKKAYQIGRTAAWAVLAILLVSVCRALVAPMVLRPENRLACLVAFGLAAILACCYLYLALFDNTPKVWDASAPGQPWRLLHPQRAGARPQEGDPQDPSVRVPGIKLAMAPSVSVTVVSAALLLILPIGVSRFLGVLAALALCLLLLTAFYAMLEILAQRTDPPHLFRLLGTRRSPVVAIVAAIGLLSTILATGTSLHEIRRPSAADAYVRPTLAAAFTTWQQRQQDDCALSVPAGGRTLHVQPLILIAAEGGGIRAAWWTVDVMTAMSQQPCGRNAIFLASGVSGGAVGLGVMARAAKPYEQLAALAGPDALAAGTEGLLSRDLVAGSFGIGVHPADAPSGDDFPDRAALMEQTWERQIPQLAQPFPAPPTTIAPWHTVFNGTSVGHDCRVLVSDVELSPNAASCDDPANPIAGAYDLFQSQPCYSGLPTSTASLLAGRFPYVTPSGVVSACGGKFDFADQIIDGGYSENSGIDTVDATLNQLMPTVRATNAAALAGIGEAKVVVPVVIFLHNTVVASSAGLPKTPKAKAEVIVPPSDSQTDAGVLAHTSTLLQRADATARQWMPDTGDAASIRTQVGKSLPQQTMTVAPQQSPALALPLGWTLSTGTRASLDDAFDAYLTCRPTAGRTCAQSSAFDGLLRDWHTMMSFPPK